MFMATSFVMAKKWREPRYPSTNPRTHNTGSSHTMEYCLAVRGSKDLPSAVEGRTGGRHETRRRRHKRPRGVRFIRKRPEQADPYRQKTDLWPPGLGTWRGSGRGWRAIATGDGVPFRGGENALKQSSADGCTTLNIRETIESHTFNG